MVHGYMLFFPSSPGRLMDMNYYLLRSGTQMDRLNGMGELFLDSVSFAD